MSSSATPPPNANPAGGSNPARGSNPTSRLEWIGAGFTGLLVVIVAGLYMWGRSVAPPSAGPELKPVPLTSMTTNSEAWQASFSPDGKQVVYSWNGEARDNFDIYIKSIDSSTTLRLTTDAATDFAPKWSPDGRNIAFLRGTGAGRATLLLVPAMGGAERKIADLFANSEHATLSWTPDSKWLVTSGSQSDDQPERVLTVSLETGEIRAITPSLPLMSDIQPALSPNGRTLAFIRHDPTNLIRRLETLPLSGQLEPRGEPRPLPIGRDVDPRAPAWTADGGALLFSTFAEPASLYRISVAGGNPSLLSWAHGNLGQPAVSPQGRRLVYTRRLPQAQTDYKGSNLMLVEGFR